MAVSAAAPAASVAAVVAAAETAPASSGFYCFSVAADATLIVVKF